MNRFDYRFETKRLEGTVVVADHSKEAAVAKVFNYLRQFDTGPIKIRLRSSSNSWPDSLPGILYAHIRVKKEVTV